MLYIICSLIVIIVFLAIIMFISGFKEFEREADNIKKRFNETKDKFEIGYEFILKNDFYGNELVFRKNRKGIVTSYVNGDYEIIIKFDNIEIITNVIELEKVLH